MKKFKILILLAIVAFTSCEFEAADIEYNLGTTFVTEPVSIHMIDTVEVKTFTIVPDSFKTSGGTRLLAGSFTNIYGIETYCESYFRVDPAEIGARFEDSAVFDSLYLIMFLDGYHFGDTTKVGEFEVFRVIEEIEEDDDTGYLYNVNQFKTESEPLGSFSINLEDQRQRDSIIVNLTYSLGKEIYDLVDEESDFITNIESFKEQFLYGLAIKPKNGNDAFVVGINADPDSIVSPHLRFYYHDNGLNDELWFDYFLEKHIRGTNYLAHSFIENRYENSAFNGSAILGYEGEDEKESSLNTDNVTFVQTGLMQTRIEVPDVDVFHYLVGVGAIMKGELLIKPVNESYTERKHLPSILEMDLVNKRNIFYNWLYDFGTETRTYGYLMYQGRFKNFTHYLYDVTGFVQTEYLDAYEPNYSLRLKLPFDSDKLNVDQIIIGDSEREENEMELRLYISGYDDEVLIPD